MTRTLEPILLVPLLLVAGCASQGTSDRDYAGQGQRIRECPAGHVQVCSSKSPGRRTEDGSMAQDYDSCVCRLRY